MTEVGIGNRKDIRDGVESALKAVSWSSTTSHNRSQVMYYLAENLSKRKDEFTTYLENLLSDNDTDTQVENSIRNLFYYAAWSDKLDGIVHQAPIRANTLAINEPIGVIAILCSDYMSFLSFVTILGLAISQGNRVVIIPSEKNPLTCLDFFR